MRCAAKCHRPRRDMKYLTEVSHSWQINNALLQHVIGSLGLLTCSYRARGFNMTVMSRTRNFKSAVLNARFVHVCGPTPVLFWFFQPAILFFLCKFFTNKFEKLFFVAIVASLFTGARPWPQRLSQFPFFHSKVLSIFHVYLVDKFL